MGYGDELMAVGEAELIHRATGKKVAIGRSETQLVYSPMEFRCPWVLQKNRPLGDAVLLQNVSGMRPYIDYARSTKTNQALVQTFRPNPGKLFFTEQEVSWASLRSWQGGLTVFVEPHVKGTFSGKNKQWPWQHWQDLVLCLKADGYVVVQMSRPKARLLKGVDGYVQTPRVREALCAMSFANCVVSSEGLLHHAAAGMPKIKAVVLWGDRHNPDILGYPEHTNMLSPDHGQFCGSITRCTHCEASMEAIHPEAVAAAVDEALVPK